MPMPRWRGKRAKYPSRYTSLAIKEAISGGPVLIGLYGDFGLKYLNTVIIL